MSLPTSTPAAESIDAAGIAAFLDAVAGTDAELHSVSIARHGAVVASGTWAPYRVDRVNLVYSLSKSLTATAIGFLVADGALTVTDPVLSRLPEIDCSSMDPRWQQVTIEHCLSMTIGHAQEGIDAAERWALSDPGNPKSLLQACFQVPLDAEPGTIFAYNQICTYLLSRVVAHVSGHQLTSLLRERLFDPLGLGELAWLRSPDGFDWGFSGAHLSSSDLHSVVQLWLDRGASEDRRLLPESWFDAATRPFLAVPEDPVSDWANGYGYSYWIARHGYRGDGAFGQFGIVLPEQDISIVLTGESQDMQQVLTLLWEHLLPAVDRAGCPASDTALAARMADLRLPAVTGVVDPPTGRLTFSLDHDADPAALPDRYSTLTLDSGSMTLTRDGVDVTIPVGDGHWADGEFVAVDLSLPTAASGGWTDDDTFTAEIRFVETPHRLQVRARRSDAAADVRWHLTPLHGTDPLDLAFRGTSTGLGGQEQGGALTVDTPS